MTLFLEQLLGEWSFVDRTVELYVSFLVTCVRDCGAALRKARHKRSAPPTGGKQELVVPRGQVIRGAAAEQFVSIACVFRRTSTHVMSSSCVPPKNCAVHDPDVSTHDDHSDTSSECGSLCSCESGSTASLSTIDRAPVRNTATQEAPPAVPQAVPQTTGVEGNAGYFPVRVPQRATSGRERRRCGGCQRTRLLAASLRHFLLTMSEFFPWVAGFVIIYYSYCWWGMGSGFSAFLFMIGAHAVIRLVKTRGVLSCVPYKSQPHVEGDHSSSVSMPRPARRCAP